MARGHEDYAIDYEALFGEEDIYTRPDGDGGVDYDEAERSERVVRSVRAPQPAPSWHSMSADEVMRFQKAGEAVRRLRAEGKGVSEIMTAFKLRDPGTIRRLESVLDWLAAAGDDPRAAALGALSKPTFLAVVCRGIMTVDDLADKAAELATLPVFGATAKAEIRQVLVETYLPTMRQ